MSDDDNLYRRGNTWYGRIQVAGQDLRRSLRTGDRAEAKRRRDAWLKEVSQAAFYGDARLSWQDAVLRYVETILPGQVKPATAERYLCSFRMVDPILRDQFIDRIDRRQLAELVAKRKASGAANATINRDLTAVSQVLAAAIEWGAGETNAAHDFNRKLMTRERREPPRPVSDADLAKVLAKASTAARPLIFFLARTGCRQSEAVNLEWPQVNLARGEVTFWKTKTSRPRTIRLDADTVALLAAQPRHITGAGPRFVFWRAAGEPYRQFATLFAALVRDAGVAFRCHDLRHTFAIKWMQRGGDIYRLKEHLGHTTVATTEIYLGYAPGGGRTDEGISCAGTDPAQPKPPETLGSGQNG